jgi:prepilin-type N-terminal cleavage/methylation domain-containing protein
MTGKFKKQNNRGFTLIETLVAVLILASTIVGPLSIASRSLNNALVAKDQVTAFFLAQDAVEYARYVRDTNRLLGADWLLGTGGTGAGVDLATPCTTAQGCYLDSTAAVVGFGDVPTVCDNSSGCPLLNYDQTNSRFTYASVSSTITRSLFTRKIVLTSINATEQQLVVTVSWNDVGGVTRTVTVNENIFAWQ